MLLLSMWCLLYLVSFYLFLPVYIILLLYLNVVVILFCVLGNQLVIQLLSPIRKRNKEKQIIPF